MNPSSPKCYKQNPWNLFVRFLLGTWTHIESLCIDRPHITVPVHGAVHRVRAKYKGTSRMSWTELTIQIENNCRLLAPHVKGTLNQGIDMSLHLSNVSELLKHGQYKS